MVCEFGEPELAALRALESVLTRTAWPIVWVVVWVCRWEPRLSGRTIRSKTERVWAVANNMQRRTS